MGLFCIYMHDAPQSNDKRIKHQEAHLEYLRALNQKGQLFAAGPLMTSAATDATPCGSLLIVDFEDAGKVEEWINQEPYRQAAVYETVEIKPYIDGMSYC